MLERPRLPFEGKPTLYGRGKESSVWRILDERGLDRKRFLVKSLRRDGIWREHIERDVIALAKDVRRTHDDIRSFLPRRSIPKTHFLIGEDIETHDDAAPTVLIVQERIIGAPLNSFIRPESLEHERAIAQQLDAMAEASLRMWDHTRMSDTADREFGVRIDGTLERVQRGIGVMPEIMSLANIVVGRRVGSRAQPRPFLVDTHALAMFSEDEFHTLVRFSIVRFRSFGATSVKERLRGRSRTSSNSRRGGHPVCEDGH